MKKFYTLALSALTVISASAADYTKLKATNTKSLTTSASLSRAGESSVSAQKAVACYFDGNMYENLGDYYVIVSDTETATYDQNLGAISATDGWVISFDFINEVANPIKLIPGTYKAVLDPYPNDPEKFQLLSDYSVCQYFDKNSNVTIEAVIVGDIKVSVDDDDVYTLSAKAQDESGKYYDVNYTGRLPFVDPSQSFSVLRQIMEDRPNEKFVGGMGFYYGTSLQTTAGGELMVQLYSTEFNDENGMQYDESTMLCLDFVGRPFPNGEPTLDEGTYPIVNYREAVRGNAIAAREMTYMSQTMGIGTYLRDRSSSKYPANDPYAYAYLASGDIVVKKTDAGYKITLENGVTDLGYRVSFEYEGPIGPFLDYSGEQGSKFKSTITDDVDMKLDDLPMARIYNGGIINGCQTFLFDIGSRSGMDEQRVYGGDIIRLQFVNEAGSPIVAPGTYNVMDEKYETYFEPGKLGQTVWASLGDAGTDISGTCYIHFEEDRFLVMDDYAWFLEGSATVSCPTEGQPEGYDNRIYNLDINLTSDNGFYVTGKWQGTAKLMYDPNSLSAIGAVESDGSDASVAYVGNGQYNIVNFNGEVKVYNVAGQSCGTFSADETIDLSHMPAGVYIFKLGKTTCKVVK